MARYKEIDGWQILVSIVFSAIKFRLNIQTKGKIVWEQSSLNSVVEHKQAVSTRNA